MADQPGKPSLLQGLKTLGRAMVDLGRAFKGESPQPLPKDAEKPELPLMLAAPQEHAENAQLLTQHTPGWHVPHPTHLPAPTDAPAMTAFGIVFIALGAVTVWPLSVIGAFIFVLAIAKWIGELLA